jgi:hypothetical protein
MFLVNVAIEPMIKEILYVLIRTQIFFPFKENK